MCWKFCRNYQSNVSTKMYSFKFFFGIASLFTFLYMIFIVLNGPPLEQISLMWTVDTSHQLIQEHIANDKNYIDRYLHLIQIDSYFAYLYAPFLAMVIQGKTPYELWMEMKSRKRNNYVLKENNVHVYFNKWYPMFAMFCDLMENNALQDLVALYPYRRLPSFINMWGYSKWLTTFKFLFLIISMGIILWQYFYDYIIKTVNEDNIKKGKEQEKILKKFKSKSKKSKRNNNINHKIEKIKKNTTSTLIKPIDKVHWTVFITTLLCVPLATANSVSNSKSTHSVTLDKENVENIPTLVPMSVLARQKQAWQQLNQLYTTYTLPPNTNKGTIAWDLTSTSKSSSITSSVTSSVTSSHISNFHLLPSFLSKTETNYVINTLKTMDFDTDQDTVDDAPTYEFYLEKNGSFTNIASIPGKPDRNQKVMSERLPIRTRISKLLRPIIKNKLMPHLNTLYPDLEKNLAVCWSFVRKYNSKERVTHDMHFDLNALVTVVIGLNDNFQGGLYVSTGTTNTKLQNQKKEKEKKKKINDEKFLPSRYYLPLKTGDAVIHQSDLLHGVRVESGHRWSWILWLKEKGCNSDPSTWQYNNNQKIILKTKKKKEKKEEKKEKNNKDNEDNDPISLFLRAKRTASLPLKVQLLTKASDLGFGRATNELGMLYKESNHQKYKAKDLFIKAANEQNDPEGMYNLGNVYVTEGNFKLAVELFHRSASQGNSLAMYNVGVANLKGVEGLPNNKILARKWFMRCETSDGWYAAATTFEIGTKDRKKYLLKAIKLGNVDAKLMLKQEYGEEERVTEL